MKKSISNDNVAALLLRAGLAVVFLYAAVSSLQHPLEWVGFLPNFLTKSFSATAVLKLFATYELLLLGWLLSGKYAKYCALLCTITLFGIVAMDPSQLITTFRDLGLAFMSLALFFLVSSQTKD